MGANSLSMERLQELLQGFVEWLETPLFRIGGSTVTAGNLIILLVSILVLYWLATLTKRLLVHALRRTNLDLGAREAIGTLARYMSTRLPRATPMFCQTHPLPCA